MSKPARVASVVTHTARPGFVSQVVARIEPLSTLRPGQWVTVAPGTKMMRVPLWSDRL